MIIVSQDKDVIVNFDNVTQIFIVIDKENENQKPYLIRYESVGDYYETLGKYATEGRAKEVLREIISMYQGSLLLQYINNKAQEDIAKLFKDMDITPFKFEMPQE